MKYQIVTTARMSEHVRAMQYKDVFSWKGPARGISLYNIVILSKFLLELDK